MGSDDDPLHFGEGALHFDLNPDLVGIHKYFQAGNAELLPFEDKSFHTVILGDVLEHVHYPAKAVVEAARVASCRVVLTVFEEWRLGSAPGQYLEEGERQWHANPSYHKAYYLGVSHVNQFADSDVEQLVEILKLMNYRILENEKVFEVVHEGHPIHNWLIAAER